MQIQPGSLGAWTGKSKDGREGTERQGIGGKGDTLQDGEDGEEGGDDDNKENGSRPVPDK